MRPIIKEYTNVNELEVDIKTLKDQGINVQNIYIFIKDSEYIINIINNTRATNISYYPINNETFEKKDTMIKEKFKTLDIPENEIDMYVKHILNDKIFLIVNDSRIKGVL
ncbi:general stress protein [Staphylococcus equorum]|uniref:general stress protein n=1 Tax=Staphylococcus equorum TaxID=246432 RepID=UPI0021C1A122|nr:general stress protein [Staphylococcus equorum]